MDFRSSQQAGAMEHELRKVSTSEQRLVRNTALTIIALVALRLVAAAWTPLTFD